MEVFVAIEHLPPRLHLQPRNCQHIILLVFFPNWETVWKIGW